jgi:hypothetical protein
LAYNLKLTLENEFEIVPSASPLFLEEFFKKNPPTKMGRS